MYIHMYIHIPAMFLFDILFTYSFCVTQIGRCLLFFNRFIEMRMVGQPSYLNFFRNVK